MRVLLTSCLIILLSANTFAHVNLTSPVGGEGYDAGEIVSINWQIQINHPQDNWDLYFSPDGGATWQDLAIDLPVAQLSFSWTVPDIITSQARIRIVMDNTGTDYEAISNDFSVGVFKPLKLNYPLGGESLLGGTTEQITWQVDGAISFDYWNLYFSEDGGASWLAIAKNLLPTTLMYDWTVPQITADQGRIKLEMDSAGTIYKDISGVFTIAEEVVTALNELKNEANNLQVYPNPFSQCVSFKINSHRSAKLKIFNHTGQLIFNKSANKISPTATGFNWQPQDIPSGIYYYQLHSSFGVKSGKLVYQK